MRGWAEIAIFLGLATAVHAAVIVGTLPAHWGAESAGSEGKTSLTLAAAPASLASLVEDWTVPPDTGDNPAAIQSPGAESNAPRIAAPADSTPQYSLPAALATVPQDRLLLTRPVAPARAPQVLAKAIAPEWGSSSSLFDSVPQVSPVQGPVDILAKMPTTPPPRMDAAPERVAELLPARALRAPPPRPSQTARSHGGQPGAEQSSPAADKVAAVVRGPSASAMAAWGAGIRARIDARKLPPTGRWSPGRVVLRITVGRDGRVSRAALLRSSGDARLDKAALGAVRRAGRMPPAPEGFAGASVDFDLPVSFTR